ncbi:MAG: choice-of-anchor tandem repeat NxxGxxAF-containing protein [Bryobacteraceae bacterium]
MSHCSSMVRSVPVAMVLAGCLMGWPGDSKPTRYEFTTVAKLGQTAPNGSGALTFGFEHVAINNHGNISFGAYLPDGSEAMFYFSGGRLRQIATPGQEAPGGGTFDPWGLCGGPTAIDYQGDVIFAFALTPYGPAYSQHCGLYRYSAGRGKVSAIVVPGKTLDPWRHPFRGAGGFTLSLNPLGAVFGAMFESPDAMQGDNGLGIGVFAAGLFGIRKVVAPGDPGPDGKTFDYAQNVTGNLWGDVAFGGHLKGEKCKPAGSEAPDIFCYESVFLKDGWHGGIHSIARQDTPIPASAGAGEFDFAFGPIINARRSIVFIGGLKTDPPVSPAPLGVFRWSNGVLRSVARPGDLMPGGRHLVNTSFYVGAYDLNERDDITFVGVLDNGDHGVYLWSDGSLSLVAKKGTILPGIGEIEHLNLLGTAFGLPTIYPVARMNDRGEIVFGAQIKGGAGVLVKASPR